MKPDRIARFEMLTVATALVAAYFLLIFGLTMLTADILHLHWFTQFVVNLTVGYECGYRLRPTIMFFGKFIKYDQLVRGEIGKRAAEDRKNGIPEPEIRRRKREFRRMAQMERSRIMSEADKP